MKVPSSDHFLALKAGMLSDELGGELVFVSSRT